MSYIEFYEKPGCINNTRQKKLLRQAGHEVDAKDLLTTEWDVDTLKNYFAGYPVAEWFNRSAPEVKSGVVNPDKLKADEALAMMLRQPLLIRRPLMKVDGHYILGFDLMVLSRIISLAPIAGHVDLESCPRTHESSSCSDEGKHLS